MSVKIAVVEDHELFREGICGLLGRVEGIVVTGSYSDGKEFIQSLEHTVPDVVLMDIAMPVMDGIVTTRQALMRHPELKILVLTMFNDYFHYKEMLDAGAKGFILKDTDLRELETAVHAVAVGQTFFSSKLMNDIISKFTDHQRIGEQKKIPLTERELELISLTGKGASNKEIADKLCISIKTVESNKTKLFEKLGVANSAELVAHAIKNNLIQI